MAGTVDSGNCLGPRLWPLGRCFPLNRVSPQPAQSPGHGCRSLIRQQLLFLPHSHLTPQGTLGHCRSTWGLLCLRLWAEGGVLCRPPGGLSRVSPGVRRSRRKGEVRGGCHPGLSSRDTHVDVQESHGLHQNIPEYAERVHARQREPVVVVEEVLAIHAHLHGQTETAGCGAEAACPWGALSWEPCSGASHPLPEAGVSSRGSVPG